jgi:hypothetical protein
MRRSLVLAADYRLPLPEQKERAVTSGDCRKYAAYCLEMAEAAKTEAARVKYLELAQAWLRKLFPSRH